MNVAPIATHPVFQLVLRGYVDKDLPVPLGAPTTIPVDNVWNFEVPGITGPSYTPTVQGTAGLGASFYTNYFVPIKAALNEIYNCIDLYVRSLTDPTYIPVVYLDDGAAGHVIGGTNGAVPGENLPMNAAVTITVPFTGGKGNNGKLRKSFGPLSVSDTINGTGPTTYLKDRIYPLSVTGGTGINWPAVAAAMINDLSDGVQTFKPYLFSRNQSVLNPVAGPPIIAGWSIPASPGYILNTTIGSMRHRIERTRQIA